VKFVLDNASDDKDFGNIYACQSSTDNDFLQHREFVICYVSLMSECQPRGFVFHIYSICAVMQKTTSFGS